MKRSATLVVLALATLGANAHAALDPEKGGPALRAEAHEHPPAFCAKGAQLGPDAQRFCPLVEDGLECPALADVCHTAKAPAPPVEAEPPSDARSSFDAIGYIVFWLLVAVLALALGSSAALAIVRARRERAALGPAERGKEQTPARREATGPRAPRDLLGEARAHEDSGDHEAALYMYLDAALRALDERGAIRIASDRTNGEYVRTCRERDARDALRALVTAVESVKFGGIAATSAHTESARKRATKLVRGAAVALAIALAAFSRDGSAAGTRAADPLATSLLASALRAQGIGVKASPTALVRLPIPAASETELPALLIDLETVHPDERAREHLVAWVRAGGTLILLGHPEQWPSELGAVPAVATSRVVTARKGGGPVDDEDDEEEPRAAELYLGAIATPAALARKTEGIAAPLASTGEGFTYATWWQWDRGAIIGVASDELFVDGGIAHRQNAEIALSILAPMKARTLWIATEVDGVDGPESPLDSLTRAGFGLGLAHALVAVLLLFAAFGVRLARAKPAPPAARRAFAEHVEATGRLYARARIANHALAAYGRLFDERLRESVPRGADPAQYLAHRTGRPAEECAKLVDRTRDEHLTPLDALTLLAKLVELHETLFPRPRRQP